MKSTTNTERRIWMMVITDCQEMPIRTEEFESEGAAMARFAEISAANAADLAHFPAEIAEKPYPATVRR